MNPSERAVSGLTTLCTPSLQVRLPNTQLPKGAVVAVNVTVKAPVAPAASDSVGGDTVTVNPAKTPVALKVAAAPETLVTLRFRVIVLGTLAAVIEARFKFCGAIEPKEAQLPIPAGGVSPWPHRKRAWSTGPESYTNDGEAAPLGLTWPAP